VKERSDEPDGKACTEYYPEWKMLVKAYKGHEEEHNARHDSPQSTFGVIGHQGEIAGIIKVQPDKHDQPGQRHHGNKSRQTRHLAGDRRTDAYHTYTNQQFDYEFHINRRVSPGALI